MKYKILFLLLLTSCAHAETKPKIMRLGPAPKNPILYSTWKCIEDQVSTYGDLCAESASGYEDMTPRDAHFEGVKCAAESIKFCLGAE